jgi:hypothetical protein
LRTTIRTPRGPATPPSGGRLEGHRHHVSRPGDPDHGPLAPADLPAGTPPAAAHFPFDPSGNLGYVWHCHIIDHEDNEMMRPDMVKANAAAAVRTWRKLTNY